MTLPTGVSPQADAPDTINPDSAEMPTVSKANGTTQAPESEAFSEEAKGDSRFMPPHLEEYIPGERLPDFIDVCVNEAFLYRVSERSGQYFNQSTEPECPIRFVRRYPPRARSTDDKATINNGPDCVCPEKVLTGQLDLLRPQFLGDGNHSKVYLAPLTFPSTGLKSSVRGTVAVKLSNWQDHERDMLLREGRIYNLFPQSLQDGDLPIVPKFYGCYEPCLSVNDGNGNWTAETIPWCMNVPILLLEPCGEAIDSYYLSYSTRQSIGTLLDRLHDARFVQKSMFDRNILVQPGPLSVPRANRSHNEPSYRIIDFGRAKTLDVGFSSRRIRRISATGATFRLSRRIDLG